MTAYVYDEEAVKAELHTIIRSNGNDSTNTWLDKRLQARETGDAVQQFHLTFTAIPRFTGKNIVQVSDAAAQRLQQLAPGFFVQGWTLDRLTRVWWMLYLDADNQQQYIRTIEQSFNAAEMNELAALYSALPLLAWPEAWIPRAAEGIRSNIGIVQEAIMLHNPYPARYLPEAAWNQLVMKALFTDKPIHLIQGLDERANAALAATLSDYAHERWAAGRRVNPMQWRLLSRFLHEGNFADIQRIWHSEHTVEREAAALVCAGSNYAPAQQLLSQAPDIQAEISHGSLSWQTVADKYQNI
ncbi:EboA domain-containing protein [Chitinophaga vietnamensis]|uniref:EboA domain-containing protein n=1 Tax=Chitinophaga vietnamensis TaxID=2593957 RepID=UPI0011784DF0|nr:EboA domain-containing protein [Chitinophaga vietnamensis]